MDLNGCPRLSTMLDAGEYDLRVTHRDGAAVGHYVVGSVW